MTLVPAQIKQRDDRVRRARVQARADVRRLESELDQAAYLVQAAAAALYAEEGDLAALEEAEEAHAEVGRQLGRARAAAAYFA